MIDRLLSTGRVAAGAIAERYLKQAYGVEIVGFVSSVGKINIPASVGGRAESHNEDSDEVEDALTPEFRKLLQTVTREEVDKQITRCPHPETADRMTKVRATHPGVYHYADLYKANHSSQRSSRLHWWYNNMRYPKCTSRARRAGL